MDGPFCGQINECGLKAACHYLLLRSVDRRLPNGHVCSTLSLLLHQTNITETLNVVMSGCCCQEMLKKDRSIAETLCVCVVLTCVDGDEDRLSHYRALVETSCQVKTRRILPQMLPTITRRSQS